MQTGPSLSTGNAAIHVSAYKMAAMFRRFVLPFTKRNNLFHQCKSVSSTFTCAKFNTSDNHIVLRTIKCKGSGNTNSYLPILSFGGFALTSTSIDDNNGDDSNSDDEIEFSEGLKRKHSGIFYSSLVFSFVNRTMAEPIWSETHCYFILRLRYMAHAIPSLLLNIGRKHTSKEIGFVSYDYIKP